MDDALDDSMEDDLGMHQSDQTKDVEDGEMVPPLAAFHPAMGIISLANQQEDASLPDKGAMMNIMNGVKEDVINSDAGVHTDKETEILGNEKQFVVHGADGPFLMDKSKWPKLVISTETNSQDVEGLGELTQEESLSALLGNTTQPGEEEEKGKRNSDTTGMGQEWANNSVFQLEEEDLMDYLSDQSINSDRDNVCQGWQLNPRGQRRRRAGSK